ncbi:YaiI/YqxD family protein [Sphingobium bisphenolivorans]|uniref:YaiI/YqxD family protein n=1 Tax=Sphingobium bisphenolivorans TaxID=1335760 RepID=UPI0003A8441C|nr:YaiI/YqxD family protein [Sphingobium bisphenolivorans]
MVQILIDADACPVKDESYKVAWRYDVPVIVVSNSPIRVPAHPLVSRVVVDARFDAADDWIVEHVEPKSITVTADILLADRCLKAGCGAVIAPTGKPFTSASIGNAVAVRAIMADLRSGAVGDGIGGPAPFGKADRSRFLSVLDETVVRLRR